ncbi:uncharacterized protein LOC119551242 [Drosophila subpulchrella]|uniref:uncharacterized protein LOC119551242 n=1 Tax=Drosophila subpulchrella TaxID=1486046 RepID=UPI0018A1281F|nr:uncharacterized protein LOC119551242 [Drosophila subpulchrella]
MDDILDETTFNANIRQTARSTLLRPESTIHKELIEYAASSCRMFYIQDASAWQEWSTTNEAFQDLSAQVVCKIFLTDVLPQLDTYELTEKVKERLKLLDLHPFFRRVGQGYKYTPDCDLASRFVLQPQQDFLLTGDIQKSKESTSEGRSQIVLIDNEELQRKTCVGYNSKITHESAVLFSALLSTDQELSIGQMHDLGEIHQRLRQAKQNFEDRARVTPFRENIDGLTDDVEVFANMKSKLCKVMSDLKK